MNERANIVERLLQGCVKCEWSNNLVWQGQVKETAKEGELRQKWIANPVLASRHLGSLCSMSIFSTASLFPLPPVLSPLLQILAQMLKLKRAGKAVMCVFLVRHPICDLCFSTTAFNQIHCVHADSPVFASVCYCSFASLQSVLAFCLVFLASPFRLTLS